MSDEGRKDAGSKGFKVGSIGCSSEAEAKQFMALVAEFQEFSNRDESAQARRDELAELSGVPEKFTAQFVQMLMKDAGAEEVSIGVQFGIWLGQRMAARKATAAIEAASNDDDDIT